MNQKKLTNPKEKKPNKEKTTVDENKSTESLLFENAPVAMLVEDLFEVKTFIEKIAKEKNTDPFTLIKNDIAFLFECARLVTIKKVNKAALELYGAANLNELAGNVQKTFTKRSIPGFKLVLKSIFEQRLSFKIETVNQTLQGKEIDILLKYKAVDNSKNSLKNLIVSIEDITQNVTFRKKLEDTKKRYKEVQKIAKIGSWSYSFKTDKLFLSDNVYEMLALEDKKQQFTFEEFIKFVHPDDWSLIQNFSIKSFLQKPIQNINYRVYTKTGKLKYIKEKRTAIIKSNDKILRIIGIGQDITEQVLKEQELSHSQNILSNTLKGITAGFVILDKNSNYTYLNAKAGEFLNKTPEELIGKNIWEEFPEKEGDLFYDNFKKAKETGNPISFENFYPPWNKWFENRIIPTKKGMLVFFHEITDQIEAKKHLKIAYNIINKSSSVAILCNNELDFPIVFASKNSTQLFGYSAKELMSGTPKLYQLIYHEDREKISKKFIHLLKIKRPKEYKIKPFRILTKDKEIKWIDIKVDVIKDKDNNIVQIQGIAEDYTETKKTQDLLFEKNIKLKELFHNTPLGSIIWDKDYNVLEWNPSAEEIFGYTEEEAKSLPIKDLITPKELKEEMEFLNNDLIIKKNTGRKNINNNITKSGKIITCEWYTSVLLDANKNVIGVASLINDITERKRKEILENVLYNISNEALLIKDLKQFAYFLKDELNKVIDTRNFYIAFYDEKRDVITTPYDLEDFDNLEEFPAKGSLTYYVIKTIKPILVTKEVDEQLKAAGEIELIGEDSKIWLGVPLLLNDKAIGAIVVQSYEDENAYNEQDLLLLEFVADQVGTAILRKKMEDELKIALKKAQESDRLKSAFLANMSHEIRTPMNGIIGFSEFLMEDQLSDDRRKKFAKIVIDSGKQLLSIVNDILDISKIEAGVVKLNYEPVSINKLMDTLYNFYLPKADEKGIYLKCEKGLQHHESIIEIDKTKLQQVLTNLLSNAFKFTEKGGIKIGYEKKGDYLEFSIKDTGNGIDKELQSKLFQRFTRANVDLNIKHAGTGLGLAISKEYIELFKGKIRVDSNENGTEIYFTIPYLKPKPEMVSSVVIPNKHTIKHNEKPITILIAEDELFNRMYVEELFSKANINLLLAENGKEAVDMTLSNDEISVVFMDIKMPIMNGMEALKIIKDKKPTMPVIALSAFAMESDKTKALNKGFDDYLTKPIDKKRLFSLIDKYAKQKESL